MASKTTMDHIENMLFQIYAAEKLIVKHLPEMADKAVSPHLKQALKQHEFETRKQINRLEDVFDKFQIDYQKEEESSVNKILGKGKKLLKEMAHIGSTSKQGLIDSLLDEIQTLWPQFDEDVEMQDLVLATCAQQIEQFEIAAYEILIRLVQKIKHEDVEDLLKTNLSEEIHAGQLLSQFSSVEPLTYIH